MLIKKGQSKPRQHPFGALMTQYRARKRGLTQTRLAELTGYHQSILARMRAGGKDLTGPSGRERVVRIMDTLAGQGALQSLDDANALLLSANMSPLFERHADEARLMLRLSPSMGGRRVRRTNLPAPLNGFVGRWDEIAEVRRLLGTTRLLTLTGSGGCGKTRLAERVAADVVDQYPDGVWYVELAPITDGALIAAAIATAMGLVATDQPARARLLDHARDRALLLVLDNCENLIEAVGMITLELLHAGAEITVFATSREPLNIDGETAWRVPPMQPLDAGNLFTDRALAVRSHTSNGNTSATSLSQLTSTNALVGLICKRLDGMPLAIELAAARTSTLSLEEIVQRLDDRFNLLGSGRRGAPPRHQTLRALIDWSYDGLGEREKMAFLQLGVFVGGWELAEAVRVLSSGNLLEYEVLILLDALVAKSLVTVEEIAGVTRYQYLETIREYANERLTSHEEIEKKTSGVANIRQKHANVFLDLAERSREHLHDAHQLKWIATMNREYPNIEAALRWSLEQGNDCPTGCQLVAALFEYWYVCSWRQQDVSRWVMLAKSALDSVESPAIRAWVLLCEEWFMNVHGTAMERCKLIQELFLKAQDPVHVAMLKTIIGRAFWYEKHDYETNLRLSAEAVDDVRALNAGWPLRFCLEMLGECLRFAQRDPARAEAVYQECLLLARQAGDITQESKLLAHYLCGFAMERREFDTALAYATKALQLASLTEDVFTLVVAKRRAAECIGYLGDSWRAERMILECIADYRDRLSADFTADMTGVLARVVFSRGDCVRAGSLLTEALTIRRRLAPNSFLRGTHRIVDTMSAVDGARGEARRSACLRGIADAMFKENGHYRSAHIKLEFEPYIASARNALGDAAFEEAYVAGQAMQHERAIAYALGEIEVE